MPLPVMALASLAIEAAPTIARWFGGDEAAETTARVAGIAKAITGAATEDAAAAALRADPKAMAQFKLAVAELDATLDRAYLEDRQDARARDVKLRRAGYRNSRADLMLAMAFASFAICVWLIASAPLEGAVLSIINMAVGALLKMIGDGFAFEFGSSRGSKEKSARLHETGG